MYKSISISHAFVSSDGPGLTIMLPLDENSSEEDIEMLRECGKRLRKYGIRVYEPSARNQTLGINLPPKEAIDNKSSAPSMPALQSHKRGRPHKGIPQETFSIVANMSVVEALQYFDGMTSIEGMQSLHCSRTSWFRFKANLQALADMDPTEPFKTFYYSAE